MEMTDKNTQDIQEYFKTHKYVVIRNFLDPNIVGLVYQYCLAKVQQIDFKTTFDLENYNPDWDGTFGDTQAPSSYSAYGDVLMDTLLATARPMIEKYTGLNLIPTYSYWRLYQLGEELVRHRDRPSCEISATLCLGYNNSNLDQEKDPDYNWDIWIETTQIPGQESAPISLQPGDLIVYRGCEVDHWREKFKGLCHAQTFLHYNDATGPYQNMYDGRAIIGIPKAFQRP